MIYMKDPQTDIIIATKTWAVGTSWLAGIEKATNAYP